LRSERSVAVPYLSAMLGRRIEDERTGGNGRLVDVVVQQGAKFPPVKGLVVQTGRSRSARRHYVPWSDVRDFKPDRILVKGYSDSSDADEGDIFLYRDLLDKQIVDMDGYRIVRVSDIRIAKSGGELLVIGADVGVLAILRRLGLHGLAERLRSERSGIFRDRIVPWNLVSPMGPMPYDVRLRVPYR